MSAYQTGEYFRRRAAQERRAAKQAGDERAAQSHRELARRYADRAKAGPADGVGEEAEVVTILPPEFRILP